MLEEEDESSKKRELLKWIEGHQDLIKKKTQGIEDLTEEKLYEVLKENSFSELD